MHRKDLVGWLTSRCRWKQDPHRWLMRGTWVHPRVRSRLIYEIFGKRSRLNIAPDLIAKVTGQLFDETDGITWRQGFVENLLIMFEAFRSTSLRPPATSSIQLIKDEISQRQEIIRPAGGWSLMKKSKALTDSRHMITLQSETAFDEAPWTRLGRMPEECRHTESRSTRDFSRYRWLVERCSWEEGISACEVLV